MNASSDKEDRLTRELLDAVDQRADISQRHLARNMGVALGLTNSYLKRCIRKGLIKIKTAPANRYLYYLTPKGFTEKSRLTREYLSRSFSFYREAANSCDRLFQQCVDKNLETVVFCGASDLAEIASVKAYERGLKILGTYDKNSEQKEFIGRPLWTEFPAITDSDAYVLTELIDTENYLTELTKEVGQNKIFVPDILSIESKV